MNTSDTVYWVNSIGEVVQPWPVATLCKCMVGMKLKKAHVVACFENLGMATEAVTIPQSGHPSVFSEEDLDHAVTVSPRVTVEKLGATFQVHRRTVERRLVALVSSQSLIVAFHINCAQSNERGES